MCTNMMFGRMKVLSVLSIIVPVYNAENYLNMTLNSIRNQTFVDFECILINDGSLDRSGDICDELALFDNRFVVIHQKNGGVSCARNNGLKRATGNYIGFVDADDYIENDMYEKLVLAAENLKADVASCGVVHEYKLNKVKINEQENFFEKYNSPIDLFYNNCLEIDVLWNKIYRKELINDINFCEDISYTEDQLFVAEALLKAKSIAVTRDIKYHYLKYEQSLSKSRGSLKFWLGHVRAMEKVYRLIQESPAQRSTKNAAFEKYARSVFSLLRWAIQERDKKLYMDLKNRYSCFMKRFFEVTQVDIFKKMTYRTYLQSYFIASLFHYYFKKR